MQIREEMLTLGGLHPALPPILQAIGGLAEVSTWIDLLLAEAEKHPSRLGMTPISHRLTTRVALLGMEQMVGLLILAVDTIKQTPIPANLMPAAEAFVEMAKDFDAECARAHEVCGMKFPRCICPRELKPEVLP